MTNPLHRGLLHAALIMGAVYAAGFACVALAEVPDAALVEVNRSVNASIRMAEDQAQYGVHDRWVIDPVSGYGDCEDYALTKMARLLEMGEPEGNMAILVIAGRPAHAVLRVRGRVLDKHYDGLRKPSEYRVAREDRVRVALARARVGR